MNEGGKPHGQLCHLLIVCYNQLVILVTNVSFLKSILVILSKQLQLTYMVNHSIKTSFVFTVFLQNLRTHLKINSLLFTLHDGCVEKISKQSHHMVFIFVKCFTMINSQNYYLHVKQHVLLSTVSAAVFFRLTRFYHFTILSS